MNNSDVAAALTEVAELLELKNESGFRVRAYQNAARAVGALTEDVRNVAARGKLTDIKGVGSGIAEIFDMRYTGETSQAVTLTANRTGCTTGPSPALQGATPAGVNA